MNMKFPHQNAKAEGAYGLNKKMEDAMKNSVVTVSCIEKFIIGDIVKVENGKLSLLPAPAMNCPMCW